MMSLPPYSGDLGDAAGADIFTLDQMFGDFGYTCDDLFELAWEETGGGETMPASSGVPCCHLLLPQTTAAPESEMPLPEDEMAAWLSAIVTGDDAVEVAVVTGDPAANSGEEFRERIENKLPTRTEERRVKHKARRNPHYAETHGLTEKRRRSKINEKFKMLQQLVPGCDKSSQSLTLDRTIQYMKSLQQQLQVTYPLTTTMLRPAVYPVAQPPPFVPPAVAIGVARLPLSPRPSQPVIVGLPPPVPAAVIPFGTPILPFMPMMPATAAVPRPLMYPSSSSIADRHRPSSSSSGSVSKSSRRHHRR